MKEKAENFFTKTFEIMKNFFSRFIAIIDCLPLKTFKEKAPESTSLLSDIVGFVGYIVAVPFRLIGIVLDAFLKIVGFIKNIKTYLQKVVDVYELFKKKEKSFGDFKAIGAKVYEIIIEVKDFI